MNIDIPVVCNLKPIPKYFYNSDSLWTRISIPCVESQFTRKKLTFLSINYGLQTVASITNNLQVILNLHTMPFDILLVCRDLQFI